jgi:hypothetical protein
MGFTTSTLLDYGASRDTLVAEIKAELLLMLVGILNSQFFDRTKGVGIKNLENEMISLQELTVLSIQIVQAFAEYSESVGYERKVVVSQDWVLLDLNTDGELIISCYFILLSDVETNAEVQALSKVFKL